MHKTTTKKFPETNVLGLKGYVFGRHLYQKRGNVVNPSGHGDWDCGVVIRFASECGLGKYQHHDASKPIISANAMYWPMFYSSLESIETTLEFSIRKHCRRLCKKSDRAVIMDWGCGDGTALKQLSSDKKIRENTLFFGYGNTWDTNWNSIDGVKFLFFVKEHMVEYFRRAKLKLDFVYSHGGLDKLTPEEFIEHLKDLSDVIMQGGIIVSNVTKKIGYEELTELFDVNSLNELVLILTKK
ncbi:MAG: hypothetical protein WC501_04810 [Candidatus Micrarchaeia archaeon]